MKYQYFPCSVSAIIKLHFLLVSFCFELFKLEFELNNWNYFNDTLSYIQPSLLLETTRLIGRSCSLWLLMFLWINQSELVRVLSRCSIFLCAESQMQNASELTQSFNAPPPDFNQLRYSTINFPIRTGCCQDKGHLTGVFSRKHAFHMLSQKLIGFTKNQAFNFEEKLRYSVK